MHVNDKGRLKSVIFMSGEILSAEIWLLLTIVEVHTRLIVSTPVEEEEALQNRDAAWLHSYSTI